MVVFLLLKIMMRVSKGMRKIKEFDIVLKSDILITYKKDRNYMKTKSKE